MTQEVTHVGLQISARKIDNVTILDVMGRILIGYSNDLFAAELSKLAEGTPCDVLVNLADVTQVDSSGIRTLVELFVTLRHDGGNLKILDPEGLVLDVLEIMTLINCFPTFTDEGLALAGFRNSAAHA
jgi:anti-sigma B factor antagonist